jgi:hypothetical protein
LFSPVCTPVANSTKAPAAPMPSRVACMVLACR